MSVSNLLLILADCLFLFPVSSLLSATSCVGFLFRLDVAYCPHYVRVCSPPPPETGNLWNHDPMVGHRWRHFSSHMEGGVGNQFSALARTSWTKNTWDQLSQFSGWGYYISIKLRWTLLTNEISIICTYCMMFIHLFMITIWILSSHL
jgi:hypothetical protein